MLFHLVKKDFLIVKKYVLLSLLSVYSFLPLCSGVYLILPGL